MEILPNKQDAYSGEALSRNQCLKADNIGKKPCDKSRNNESYGYCKIRFVMLVNSEKNEESDSRGREKSREHSSESDKARGVKLG